MNPTSDLVNEIGAALRAAGVDDAPILVAVSGGADSVCLAHALHALGCSFQIAHMDHQTRERESAEDAVFVRDLAQSLGKPFHLHRWDGTGEAGHSFEQAARAARYAFFLAAARSAGCTAIATAHHAGDQAETVLMRLLRGVGPGGLAGIPFFRDDDGIRIVRPLLHCEPAAIRAWLDARGHAWREDRSNAELRHLRNRIRHELLPRLRAEYNPAVDAALCRLAEMQADENRFLQHLAGEALDSCLTGTERLERAAFARLHPALRRRALLCWAHVLGAAPGFDHIAEADAFIVDAPAGHRFDLGGGLQLYNGQTHTQLVRDASPAPEVLLAVPGVTRALGRDFLVRLLDAPPPKPLSRYCTSARQVFDADCLAAPLRVRTRRPGDRFTPLGMTGSRKIQDYFVDRGVPEPERDRVPLIEAGGVIVWVCGHAPAAAAANTSGTVRWLEIEVRHAPE